MHLELEFQTGLKYSNESDLLFEEILLCCFKENYNKIGQNE